MEFFYLFIFIIQKILFENFYAFKYHYFCSFFISLNELFALIYILSLSIIK